MKNRKSEIKGSALIRSIVLVSGGMDSLVTAAIAQQESSELFFLHVNYGQRTEQRELKSFKLIEEHYQPKDVLICDIEYLKQIGKSSLIDKSMSLEDDDKSAKVPSSYVPFRNAHLLAIATSWAETIEVNRIYIGAVEEDSSGYPDCREVFLTAFNQALNLGTKVDYPIEIKAPLLHLRKKNIVLRGLNLKAPFHYSWSCYKENEVACGKCASCLYRLKAFHEAGVIDPLPYRKP